MALLLDKAQSLKYHLTKKPNWEKNIAQSAGAVEYTDCFTTEGKTLWTSVLDIPKRNLMVRFQ